jgi:hypothetical protein
LFLYRQVSSVSSILGDTADAALVYFLFGCCLLWGFAKPWLYFLFGCCLLWGLTELPTAHCSLNYIRMHMGKRSWISCSQMLSSENGNCFFLYFSISGRSCTGYHSFCDVKFICFIKKYVHLCFLSVRKQLLYSIHNCYSVNLFY